MFSSEAWLANPSSGFYNGVATQSLRLNTPDDPRLTRTPSSGGNRKTWTFSIWIKRGVITVNQVLFGAFSSGSESNFSYLSLHVDDQIGFDAYGTSYFHTNRLLRDTTGWCNLVFAVDTTQSTSGDRVKLYVNGVQDSSFASGSMPSLNLDTAFNDTCQHTLFANHYSGSYDSEVSGYVSDINFVDGSQLTASSFGEFKNGVWIPKKYTGSYGTNGFRLEFKETGTGTASTSTIGADTSGNTNHFTSSNLASTDSNLPDCPEDNYPTMNPLHKGTDTITFTEGNLKSSFTSDTDDTHHGCTFALPKEGKWYWEQTFTGANTGGSQAPYCGIYDSDTLDLGISDNFINSSGDFITYYTHNNAIYINGSSTNYTGSIGNQSGAVVGFAVDMTNGHLWVHVNGTYINGTPTFSDGTNKVASPNTDSTYIPFWSGNGGGAMTWEANFGQTSFTYTKPDGFNTLSSRNLSEPIFSANPNRPENADYHFNTLLYSADSGSSGAGSSTPQDIGGLNFKPDWVWIKGRSYTDNHISFDSIRGVGKYLIPNLTNVEATQANTLDEFRSDGFGVGADSTALLNYQTNTYVAWNWKANGGTTTTNDASVTGVGTIDSVYQANPNAGFSIVTYTGTGSAGTLAHGLSSAPTLILVFGRSVGNSQMLGVTAYNGWTHYAAFHTSSGYSVDDATIWNDVAPTSTVFSVGTAANTNQSSATYVAYCFHDVEGYSKISTYKGNSNADGTYINTGFSPAWVGVRKISAGESWIIFDNARDTFNVRDSYLRVDTTAAETVYSGVEMDFLSNGFKLRGNEQVVNDSSHTFIYLAFAKQPFKYSNAA